MQKILVVLFLVLSPTLYSQDTIIKLNGDRLIVKISEIYPQEVSYKRLDLPDGPLYITKKDEIQFIIFSNGRIEKFDNSQQIHYASTTTERSQKIQMIKNYYLYEGLKYNEKTINYVLASSNDPRVISALKQQKENKLMANTGFIGIPFAVAAYALIIMASDSHPVLEPAGMITLGAFCIGAGIVFPIQSVKFHKRSEANQKQAIKFYNESF